MNKDIRQWRKNNMRDVNDPEFDQDLFRLEEDDFFDDCDSDDHDYIVERNA